MRILELNLERGWRGGERQTLLSALQFRRAGHDVEILARANQPLARRAKAEGLVVHELEGSGQALRFLLARGSQYCILHAQTAHMLTSCVLSRFWHTRPIVVTRRVAFPLGSRFSASKYRRADGVVAISRAAAQALQQAGVQPVAVIPSAVAPAAANPERVQAFMAHHGLDGYRVLGTMGALTPEKDPLTLVNAVHLVRQKFPDFRFVHFGTGSLRAEVEARIAALKLQDIYLLSGFLDGVEDFYAMLDGFVMSSTVEGLGSAALDAMAHGVPVVSTAAGGLAESLADGRGLLVMPGDAAALASQMERLLNEDPACVADRLRMIEHARAWVERECSVVRMGARYLQLFEELLARKA